MGNPYAGLRQWQRIAVRADDVEGEYALAVVAAHTAGEMFLDAFLLCLAWEEITYGHPDAPTREQVVAWFSSRSSLRTRLCAQYHGRLKGKWACGEPGNPVHTWLETVSKLRHKIVHGGHRPTEKEADAALNSMEEIEYFIEQLIGSLPNATKYPFTAYMMIGPPGLVNAGSYTKKVREKIEGETTNWRQSFYDFRQSVVDEIWSTST